MALFNEGNHPTLLAILKAQDLENVCGPLILGLSLLFPFFVSWGMVVTNRPKQSPAVHRTMKNELSYGFLAGVGVHASGCHRSPGPPLSNADFHWFVRDADLVVLSCPSNSFEAMAFLRRLADAYLGSTALFVVVVTPSASISSSPFSNFGASGGFRKESLLAHLSSAACTNTLSCARRLMSACCSSTVGGSFRVCRIH